MEEHNNEIEDNQINDQEKDIINYITEQQFKYEVEAQEKISREVKEKFGDLGEKVFKLVNDGIEDGSIVESCEDCGKISEEILKETQDKISNIDIFLDDKLDEMANIIIKEADSTIIRESDMKRIVCEHTDHEYDNIPKDLLVALKKKVLFLGIVDGWLLDENFVKD